VVFLAEREGVPTSSYLPRFEAERKFITNQLNGPDTDWFISKVQEAATAAANSTAETDARKTGARR
jgi:hypothetical protein